MATRLLPFVDLVSRRIRLCFSNATINHLRFRFVFIIRSTHCEQALDIFSAQQFIRQIKFGWSWKHQFRVKGVLPRLQRVLNPLLCFLFAAE